MGLLFYSYKDVGILLRSLDSITEEEVRYLYKGAECENEKIKDLREWIINKSAEQILFTPTAWIYLLSKGFDLFGLIEAGLAKEIKP